MKSETLHLTLKKKWFDMIKSGEKKEEYRDITPFWTKRLCFFNEEEGVYEIYPFKEIEFTLGYPKKEDDSKRIKFKLATMTIGLGKPEWGAAEGVNYFVIRLGEEIK